MSNITKDLLPLAKPITMFTLDPNNAKKHGDDSVEVIFNSIKDFQQRKPIVVQEKDGQFIVRAGNGTLQAALKLGWTEIAAVIVAEDDVTATAYALADNKTAEKSEWDDYVLQKQLAALMDVGISVEDYGFDIGDVDKSFTLSSNKELGEDSFSNFQHSCPRCGFEFDDDKNNQSTKNGSVEPE